MLLPLLAATAFTAAAATNATAPANGRFAKSGGRMVPQIDLHSSSSTERSLCFVHIAKTGGSSFDVILRGGVGLVNADCIVEKRHYEETVIPLERRYNFPACRIVSTEFSLSQVRGYIGKPDSAVHYITFMREPFSRIWSQHRHDKQYTPEKLTKCRSLDDLLKVGSDCIVDNGRVSVSVPLLPRARSVAPLPSLELLSPPPQPAYRYQNFMTMMMGGCKWDHRKRVCLATGRDGAVVASGGAGVRGGHHVAFQPADVLGRFVFVGFNEHFLASVCLFYYTFKDHWRFGKYCREKVAHVPHVWKADRPKRGDDLAAGLGVDPHSLRLALLTNEMDFKLYWTAYDDFVKKVAHMEKMTGVRVFASPK